MKRILGAAGVILLLGLAVLFRKQLAPVLNAALSPAAVVEEDICARVSGTPIDWAAVSLDYGRTWQEANSREGKCVFFLEAGSRKLSQGAVMIHLKRISGQEELWKLFPDREMLLAQSSEPISLEQTAPAARESLMGLFSTDRVALVIGALFTAAFFLSHTYRQTRLLEEIRQTGEQTSFLLQKSQRKAVELSALPGGAAGWIANRLQEGFGIYPDLNEAAILVLERYPLIHAIASDGCAIAISPHPKKVLLKRSRHLKLDRKERSRLARLTHDKQALEVVKWGKAFRHALGPSGETFDIEARMLAEQLDFKWGQPDFLYFYMLRKD